ncbi:MAG: YraN family protein, partial [Pseudomonadota bacterium]
SQSVPRGLRFRRAVTLAPRDEHARRRQRREAFGRWAEWFAAALLILRGYRILGRRVRTGRGEIDIVAVRGRRLAFVEVKARATATQAEAAVSPHQAARLVGAAAAWVRRHARYRDHRIAFDRFEVAGLGHLRHVPDALAPLG